MLCAEARHLEWGGEGGGEVLRTLIPDVAVVPDPGKLQLPLCAIGKCC